MAKSLKDQNNWKIWLFVSANSAFLYAVLASGVVKLDGIKEAMVSAVNIIPAAFAGIVATGANALFSSQAKARLVYLRWNNPLPGHRAFTKYAVSDPRIDLERLKTILGGSPPVDEGEQNQVWFKMFKTVENKEPVVSVHRDFLLMRDFTALSALSLVIMGSIALISLQSKRTAAIYLLILLGELLLFRQAAANCGIRMVTNTLSLKTGSAPRAPRNSKTKTEIN